MDSQASALVQTAPNRWPGVGVPRRPSESFPQSDLSSGSVTIPPSFLSLFHLVNVLQPCWSSARPLSEDDPALRDTACLSLMRFVGAGRQREPVLSLWRDWLSGSAPRGVWSVYGKISSRQPVPVAF
ncbi:hypothetical protein ACOMHN_039746 [Nucella lapillus]